MWFGYHALWLACGPPPGQPGSVLLARHPDAVVALELPESSRSTPLAGAIEVAGFSEVRRENGRVEWARDLPFRSPSYWRGTRTKPPKMRVTGRRFEARVDAVGPVGTWSVQDDQVFVVTDGADPGAVRMVWPQAWAHDRALSKATDDRSDLDFALRTMPVRAVHEHGVYLPAPGRITFRVEVPRDGHLWTRIRLLDPAVGASASDGAEVRLRVQDDVLESWSVDAGSSRKVTVDLSGHAGETVEITLETLPGVHAEHDHVFFTEPVLYTPSDTPRRVGLVFIDTLRQDAVGVYGGGEATPGIDAFAQDARIFDQARAPAPWTLPSGRAALTGRHPHRWDEGPHVGEWLAREGFLTGAVVGNSYLTENFDLGDGWSVHDGLVGRGAGTSVKRSRDLLETHAERDLALVLHVMEPHLPYPADDVGPAPEGLAGTIDDALAQSAYDADPSVEGYLRRRYAADVARADQHVTRFIEALGPDAIVVVFSDHGEELFEHGRIGHGRTLVEELMLVPLIIRAPGLPVGRSSTPATLQDIVPTLAQALGVPVEDVDGSSLYDEVERPIALGTPLFGPSAVGVVHQGRKWVATGADEAAFDLASDPGEDAPLAATEADAEALAQALGQPVHRVLMLEAAGDGARFGQAEPVSITVQGGIERVWTRPGETHAFVLPKIVGDTVTLSKKRHPRELFVLPKDAAATWTTTGTVSPVRRPHEDHVARELDDTTRRSLEALGYVE